MKLGETTSSQAEDTRTPWDKKAARRKVLLSVGLPALFIGTGWAFLSQVDGWLGVALWIMISVPLCFLAEFLLRRQTTTPRSPKSNPRMRVRTPVRGDVERRQPSARGREPDFPWNDDKARRPRRRTYAR